VVSAAVLDDELSAAQVHDETRASCDTVALYRRRRNFDRKGIASAVARTRWTVKPVIPREIAPAGGPAPSRSRA
jgi:hypothetical protein